MKHFLWPLKHIAGRAWEVGKRVAGQGGRGYEALGAWLQVKKLGLGASVTKMPLRLTGSRTPAACLAKADLAMAGLETESCWELWQRPQGPSPAGVSLELESSTLHGRVANTVV